MMAFGNTFGQRENACNQQFLLLLQCFPLYLNKISFLSSANAYNMDISNFLSFGMGNGPGADKLVKKKKCVNIGENLLSDI